MYKVAFIFLLIFFGCAECRPRNHTSSFSHKMRKVEPLSLHTLEQRLDEVYEDLQRIKLALFTNNNKDSLDLRVLKCAAELSNGNEQGATKYWKELEMYLATHDLAKAIASRIIQRVDLGGGKSPLPLINFFQYMNVPQAYGALISKLKDTGNLFSPTSFILAENIKEACGVDQPVFINLPQILRDVTGSVVTLKNAFNGGYLYYQSDPSKVFTWFSLHKNVDLIHGMSEARKPKGMWEFMLQGDKMQIINVFNGDELIDSETLFHVELVGANEIRLKVAESGNKEIVGKYLAGKVRNKGEQYTLVDFLDPEQAHVDQLRWSATPGDRRAVPDQTHKC